MAQRLRLLLLCTQIASHVLTFFLQQQGGDVLVNDAAVVQTKGAAARWKYKMNFRAGVRKEGEKKKNSRKAVADLQYWVMMSGVILLLFSSTGIRFLFISGC